jgi:DNA-directed RNA polymerase subunit RPC12/RpoP
MIPEPVTVKRPLERCTECDREVEHYNTFLSPTNERRVVCWECRERADKRLNSKRTFYRSSRQGLIPR